MTATAIWNVGKLQKSQRERTLALVTEVKKVRKEVEDAASEVDINSTRLRNMAGELIRENTEALREAHEHATHPSSR